LFALKGHLSGAGGDPALGQRIIGASDALARLAALGAGRRQAHAADMCIGLEMLLQEPDGQIASEVGGAFLPLIEGDELVLGLRVEHEVEGSSGLFDPPAPQFLALDVRGWLRFVHDDYS
jgi:hypothetical protein